MIEPGKSRVAAGLKFYGGLLGWIHLQENFASAIMLLPRRAGIFVTEHALPKDDSIIILRSAIRRTLDRRLRRARVDLMFVALIYASAFYLYGGSWPIFLTGVAARALIVSVQDNVAHYGTPAVVGAPAHNSKAWRWASLFMLNQNLHGAHHDRPELPWNGLPGALESTGSGYAGSYLALAAKQFYGPRQSFAATAVVNGLANKPKITLFFDLDAIEITFMLRRYWRGVAFLNHISLWFRSTHDFPFINVATSEKKRTGYARPAAISTITINRANVLTG